MTITPTEIALTLTYLRDAGLLIATDTQATTWADYLSCEIPELDASELPEATRAAITHATETGARTVTVGHLAKAIKTQRHQRIDAETRRNGQLDAPRHIAADVGMWLKWIQTANSAIGRGATRAQAEQHATARVEEIMHRRLSDARKTPNPTPGSQTTQTPASAPHRPHNAGASTSPQPIGSTLNTLQQTLNPTQGAAA